MDAASFLEYGALGLLTLVLIGVGWALKAVLGRWLNQVEAGIRAQEAGTQAMAGMAAAMTALAASVLQHDKDAKTEHKVILDAVCKKQTRAIQKPKAP